MFVRELHSIQFTERLEPIFRHIEAESGIAGRFDPAYFFPHWRKLMELGIARTWEVEGAVLGALFANDTFNGRLMGLVMFWFALPAVRGTGAPLELLAEFESAAKKAGCKVISSAAYEGIKPMHTSRIYQNRGYDLTESIFSQVIGDQ